MLPRPGRARKLGSNPQISPAFCCGRRCAAPSGVFSPRGARRTASTRSAPPRGPAGPSSVVRCVRHGSVFEATRRRRCPSIAEERQRQRRGHAAATLRADGGRGRSLRCSSSKMLGHRLPPRALISTHETHRRTALGDPGRASGSQTPLGTSPLRPRDEGW